MRNLSILAAAILSVSYALAWADEPANPNAERADPGQAVKLVADTPPGPDVDPVLVQLQRRLKELKEERANLQVRGLDGGGTKEIDAHIAKVEAAIKERRDVVLPARAAFQARLAALPDNSWLNLKPSGMAKARMYSGCCFGGGLLWYFGGAHRGYKGNDVQLYDPKTNAWIQATEPEWPEVGSPDWKAMTGGGGSTSKLSPTGRPFTEHTYQQACWQPDRKRFFVVLVSSGVWEFDPAKREWIHLIDKFKKEKPTPGGSWAQNHVLYDPTLAAPVLTVGSGGDANVYRFDHAKAEWVSLGATPDELKWNEFYSTWVPQWKAHLISTMKKGLFKYELPSRKLTPVETPEALKGCQSLAYDTANGVVIALARVKVSDRVQAVRPWALDLATMKWAEPAPPKPWPGSPIPAQRDWGPPQGQCTGNWAKLWYDPELNVHLFVNDVRRDRVELFDGGVTETWAYRYKGTASTGSSAPKGRALNGTAPNGKPSAEKTR